MAAGKRRKTGRVTLAQVAEYIGVTSMTVSRALRTPEAVSPEMRDKVDSAVKKLGYMPNQMAGALASASSRIIAVVTPAITSPGWQKALNQLQKQLHDKGYTVFYSAAPDSQEASLLIKQLLQLSPAALMTAAIPVPENCRTLLEQNNIPFIEMLDISAPNAACRVGIDNRQAAIDLTEHLIERGYSRIGFIGCRNYTIQNQQRMKGWREAMMSHYLVPERLVSAPEEPDFLIASQLFRRMRENWNDVDAVICSDSLLATGLLFECQRQLLTIPQHLALATFDEQELCASVHPGLSAITIPLAEVADRAGQQLIAMLSQQDQEPSQIRVGYTLDVRDSS